MTDTTAPRSISRRGLLSGLGVAGTVGAVAGNAWPATAQPAHPSAALHPDTSPITSSIASTPVVGKTYVSVGEFDFSAESSASLRTFGGNGVYTATGSSTLWATVDLPLGATLYDVEWYVYNSSAGAVTALGRLWTPDTGFLGTSVADVTIPTGTATTATRFVVPSSTNGPYPSPLRLFLGLPTPSDGSVQANGVRVGFAHAPLSTTLLTTPIRVYDSTAHTPISSGQKKVIDLTGKLHPASGGALLSVTALNTHSHGELLVGQGTGAGTTTVVRWARAGDIAVGQSPCLLSSTRTVVLASAAGSGATDYYVDLVGYLI